MIEQSFALAGARKPGSAAVPARPSVVPPQTSKAPTRPSTAASAAPPRPQTVPQRSQAPPAPSVPRMSAPRGPLPQQASRPVAPRPATGMLAKPKQLFEVGTMNTAKSNKDSLKVIKSRLPNLIRSISAGC